MSTRDPKIDPAAGDVVHVGFEARTVLEITPSGAIHYRGDRHAGLCSLDMWRAWTRGVRRGRAKCRRRGPGRRPTSTFQEELPAE